MFKTRFLDLPPLLAAGGNVRLPEESSANFVFLRLRDGFFVQELPFAIELKQFRVEFYPTGQPKNFESDVLIHDADRLRAPLASTIKVNHPLVYRGYAIYQADFGDGVPQIAGAAVGVRVEEADAVAAGLFGQVHGLVGVADQGIGVCVVGREDAHADARTDADLADGELEGGRQGGDDPGEGLFALAKSGKGKNKLDEAQSAYRALMAGQVSPRERESVSTTIDILLLVVSHLTPVSAQEAAAASVKSALEEIAKALKP